MEIRVLRLISIGLLLIWLTPSAVAAGFDHSAWNDLLRLHVSEIDEGRATQVNYDGMLADRTRCIPI